MTSSRVAPGTIGVEAGSGRDRQNNLIPATRLRGFLISIQIGLHSVTCPFPFDIVY